MPAVQQRFVEVKRRVRSSSTVVSSPNVNDFHGSRNGVVREKCDGAVQNRQMRTGQGAFSVGLQVSFGVFKNDTFAGRSFSG
jgi:hypothetical protein